MGAGLLRRHYVQKEKSADLSDKSMAELKAMAKDKGIKGYSALDKSALAEALKE